MGIFWPNLLYLLGIITVGMASMLTVPLVREALQGWSPLCEKLSAALVFTVLTGTGAILAFAPKEKVNVNPREGFILIMMTWVSCCVIGALPFHLAMPGGGFDMTDALFDAVSALTTTGFKQAVCTAESGSHAVMLWRSMLEWIGGIGIVVMVLSILPSLGAGGLQLLRQEFSDRSEKILPKVSQVTASIVIVYGTATLAGAVLLFGCGLAPSKAFSLSISAISTSGYANGLPAGSGSLIEFILALLMVIGASPLMIMVKIWKSGWKATVYNDRQAVWYVAMLCAFSVMSAAGLIAASSDTARFSEDMLHGFFYTASFLSTTGFCLDGVGVPQWNLLLLFIMAIFGGCAGSTSGGIKIYRIRTLCKVVLAHLQLIRRPHNFSLLTYEQYKPVEIVFVFIALYAFSLLVLTLALNACGLSAAGSFTAALGCLSNIGSGLADAGAIDITAHGTGVKVLMMSGMLIGRLEIISIFVLLLPSFWRR